MRERPNSWLVPRLWDDGECFILGGGPSLADVNLDLLKGRRCIAVNNAFKLGKWIDAMFFGDVRWYDWEQRNLAEFAGLKVMGCPTKDVARFIDKPGIKVIERRNEIKGISTDPKILAWNYNSGACAINLAFHFGVKRIILLGFDMQKVQNQHNWHKDYPPPESKTWDPYPRFLRPFPVIAEDLKRLGVECLNATEGSALTVFPMVKLEDVLNNVV